ncbi:MAG: alpha/beta hydrolase [Acidobacteriia bacterium]|nr:alpha/beta hydrolase [Terriglobia bacterium]
MVLLGVLAVLLLARPCRTHLQAAQILSRVQAPQHPGALATLAAHPIEEVLTELPTPSGPIRARLYLPKNNHHLNAPGMLLVQGVHHLGIEEPRLMAFARAISSSGIRVLTPELLSLADYHVDRSSVDLIGYSARALSAQLGQKVGVLGLSFAGGLSLLAAADPKFAPYISFVVSVGAHDELERVSQFLISNTIQQPDGITLHLAAHEYGVLILVYSHPEDFFPPADVPAARETLRLLLWEKVDESRKQAALLSPASRQKMELLYNHQVEPLAEELRQSIARHRAEMAPVSPRGNLAALQVPVLLLHGAADNVIPPSELLWLQRDIPPKALKAALISPAISHVALGADPSLTDQWKLLHFMAQILERTEHTQPAPAIPEPFTPNQSQGRIRPIFSVFRHNHVDTEVLSVGLVRDCSRTTFIAQSRSVNKP